ncbi:LysE family translocator [Oecophyllibacter saccharovorans]|uniref:LysE family translocator n=1 Tax=Oecophyllibacter saccharovorans TaxID=2558360 RepID=A0A506UL36_9PROT|nr:LysE family translocator [Oecophyllibacter saccharovorans]TPW34049.1 LysE family translocator [Oecophyllibacter saccharovorans]
MDPVMQAVIGFATAWAILILAPGLDFIFVLRTSLGDGKKAGVGAALGVALSIGLWGVAAAFGLAKVVAVSHLAFEILKWGGALYLAYLGGMLLLRPRNVLVEDETKVSQELTRDRALPSSFWLWFRRGAVVSLLNPQLGIFDLSAYAHVMPPNLANPVAFCLMLTVLQVVIVLPYHLFVALVANKAAVLLNTPWFVNLLDRLTGLVFLWFAYQLLQAHPPV